MNKIYKEQSSTTRKIRYELQKKNEELLKILESEGFQQESIEELRFREENQLNYPTDIFNDFLLQAFKVIFNFSSRIHTDILISIIKELSSINIDEICGSASTAKERIGSYGEQIMEVIIANMETLYYFHDDNVFSELIFDVCLVLDMDPLEYGFSLVEGNLADGQDTKESNNQ